jgi:hypothetical protein
MDDTSSRVNGKNHYSILSQSPGKCLSLSSDQPEPRALASGIFKKGKKYSKYPVDTVFL